MLFPTHVISLKLKAWTRCKFSDHIGCWTLEAAVYCLDTLCSVGGNPPGHKRKGWNNKLIKFWMVCVKLDVEIKLEQNKTTKWQIVNFTVNVITSLHY